jgi:hypothetical protein
MLFTWIGALQKSVALQGFERFRLVLARRVPRDGNAVEQLACLLGREHGRLAFFHDVFGPRTT